MSRTKKMKYLSCQQCRDADRIAIEELGVPSLTLMENAGLGCADAILDLDSDDGIVILCGKGNNGGDGFVIARRLQAKGRAVAVVLVTKPESISGDAQINMQRLANTGIPMVSVSAETNVEQIRTLLASTNGVPTSVIVDAMLGTGANGRLKPPYDQVVDVANAMDVTRVAVDLPSGLNGDNGQVTHQAFRAELTCTFIARKQGMNTANGRDHCGEIRLIDIGLPEEAIQRISS